MNCRMTEQILPLHISDDLDASEASRVRSHLETCADCAGLEKEYRRAMTIFRSCEPPAVHDAVYANIRRQVLSEITQSEKQSIFPNFVNLSRIRYRWALALVVLFAVTVFVFNRLGRPTNELAGDGSMAIQQAASNPATDRQAPVSPANDLVKSPGQPAEPFEKRYLRVKAKVRATSRSGGNIAKRGRRRVNDKPLPAHDDVAILSTNDAIESQPVLRVEMQTKDPNIRIIWFSKQTN